MKYKNQDTVSGVITKIDDEYINALVDNHINFRIWKSDVSDWQNFDLNKVFKVGENINFVVKSIKNETSGLGVFKANHFNFKRSPFHHELKETQSGFKNLLKHALQEQEHLHELKNK
ncbi:hypothetical protein V2E24_00970 [Mycoplasmopsis ciconiae]|uniref:30S ribosomal protein S1 n=1 Tax=Mycoplasmopsis ciconiae TaxID=561067 RepID=A0ABU7MLK6_9BACT|nr:hypothetical protein [Mycoplasmopsis ciconiae]